MSNSFPDDSFCWWNPLDWIKGLICVAILLFALLLYAMMCGAMLFFAWTILRCFFRIVSYLLGFE